MTAEEYLTKALERLVDLRDIRMSDIDDESTRAFASTLRQAKKLDAVLERLHDKLVEKKGGGDDGFPG